MPSIQAIALERPAYGYRRLTYELRRRGRAVNHKRVLRLMREDNLLCLRKPGFVRTMDSRHALGCLPQSAPGVDGDWPGSTLGRGHYLSRLQQACVYLAVLLDAYSRRWIGWALERYLEAELALAALRMALATRVIRPGLAHHSDRGVQYASHAYTHLHKAQADPDQYEPPRQPL